MVHSEGVEGAPSSWAACPRPAAFYNPYFARVLDFFDLKSSNVRRSLYPVRKVIELRLQPMSSRQSRVVSTHKQGDTIQTGVDALAKAATARCVNTTVDNDRTGLDLEQKLPIHATSARSVAATELHWEKFSRWSPEHVHGFHTLHLPIDHTPRHVL